MATLTQHMSTEAEIQFNWYPKCQLEADFKGQINSIVT